MIRYYIYSGDGERIAERLDKELIDFGLLVEPFDIGKYDYLRLSVKDRWDLLMRKDSPPAEKDRIAAGDLWDQPLIISRQASIDDEMFAWLGRDLSKLNMVATYDLICNASRFVKMGLGYAITLDGLINTTGRSELCFRPLYPALEAGLCIVWKKYQVFSRAAEQFLKQLQFEFAPDA